VAVRRVLAPLAIAVVMGAILARIRGRVRSPRPGRRHAGVGEEGVYSLVRAVSRGVGGLGMSTGATAREVGEGTGSGRRGLSAVARSDFSIRGSPEHGRYGRCPGGRLRPREGRKHGSLEPWSS
jgi:hypothetical protein